MFFNTAFSQCNLFLDLLSSSLLSYSSYSFHYISFVLLLPSFTLPFKILPLFLHVFLLFQASLLPTSLLPPLSLHVLPLFPIPVLPFPPPLYIHSPVFVNTYALPSLPHSSYDSLARFPVVSTAPPKRPITGPYLSHRPPLTTFPPSLCCYCSYTLVSARFPITTIYIFMTCFIGNFLTPLQLDLNIVVLYSVVSTQLFHSFMFFLFKKHNLAWNILVIHKPDHEECFCI